MVIERYLNMCSGYFYFENAYNSDIVNKTYKLESELTKEGFKRGSDDERKEFNKRWLERYNEVVEVI